MRCEDVLNSIQVSEDNPSDCNNFQFIDENINKALEVCQKLKNKKCFYSHSTRKNLFQIHCKTRSKSNTIAQMEHVSIITETKF